TPTSPHTAFAAACQGGNEKFNGAPSSASARLHLRQAQMALDAADPRLELADQNPVPQHGGVISNHRAAQSGDLLSHLLAERDEIRRDVGAQRLDLRAQFSLCRVNYRVDFAVDARDVGANVAQEFENQTFRLLAQPTPRFC